MRKNRRTIYAMSSRRRTGIIVLCLIAAGILGWLDRAVVGPRLRPAAEAKERGGVRDFDRYHGKTFSVTRVVDGDTVDIDAADANSGHTRIRLLGIDAPETRSDGAGVMYFGPEATEAAKDLALGKTVCVYLDTPENTRDKYGRLLAYIQLPTGEFLNEVLLVEGFVYADLRFRHGLYNRYRQLDANARSRGRGLWEKLTRDQMPEWLQRKKPTLLSGRE